MWNSLISIPPREQRESDKKSKVNVVAQGIWEGHAEVARVILENGADVGAKDKLL